MGEETVTGGNYELIQDPDCGVQVTVVMNGSSDVLVSNYPNSLDFSIPKIPTPDRDGFS